MNLLTALCKYIPFWRNVWEPYVGNVRTSSNHSTSDPVESSAHVARDLERSSEHSGSVPSKCFLKINDSLYLIHEPTLPPKLEIIFFHGLQREEDPEAYWMTWTLKNNHEICWPSTWLAEEFPRSRIFLVSYDAYMKKTDEGGRSDMYILGENLLRDIVTCNDSRANVGQNPGCPVILVGHCFGGLVIKQLCWEAHVNQMFAILEDDSRSNQIMKFLANVKGIFYFGTPHLGISFGDALLTSLAGSLLDYAKLLSKDCGRLNHWFKLCKSLYKWKDEGLGELLPTNLGQCDEIIVPEASARTTCDSFVAIREDHFSLCRPESTRSNNFIYLKSFIARALAQEPSGEKSCGEEKPQNYQHISRIEIGIRPLAQDLIRKNLYANSPLALVGMGGVGKTTLAKVMFNILVITFEYSCFVPTFKDITGDLNSLRKKVWKNLYHKGRKMVEQKDDWQKLEGKRLLLVMDDISPNQCGALQSIIGDVGLENNCYIVTSRNLELPFDHFNFTLPTLDPWQSLQLFVGHAFPNETKPPTSLEVVTYEVVKLCGGLPLTLEVVGKYLRKKTDLGTWKETVEKLQIAESLNGMVNEQLWSKLRTSVDGLVHIEQAMFVDAATFLNNMDLAFAKDIWNRSLGRPNLTWQNLVNMSLVNDIKENESVRMHEQLRSLGRRIASESMAHGNSLGRIWETQKAINFLNTSDDRALEKIQGLRVIGEEMDEFMSNISSMTVQWGNLQKMKGLKYMELHSCSFNETFPTSLVLLNLQRMSFKKLPFDPSELKCLTILYLIDCNRLHYLPTSFGYLSSLKKLLLNKCKSLKTLPDSTSLLTSLKILEMKQCHKLQTLPERFGYMGSLEELHMMGCKSLEILPSSFANLTSLRYLDMTGCEALQVLPPDLGKLQKLEKLFLNGCKCLESIPDSISLLTSLKILKMKQCDNLRTLPERFGDIGSLEQLHMIGCKSVEILPSLGQLTSLQYLDLDNCDALQVLPPDLGKLQKLEKLFLNGCKCLESIPNSIRCCQQIWVSCRS